MRRQSAIKHSKVNIGYVRACGRLRRIGRDAMRIPMFCVGTALLNLPGLVVAQSHAVNSSWWDKALTDPVATFTGLLALVTIGLIAVGVWQALVLSHTVQSAERASMPFLFPRLRPEDFNLHPLIRRTERVPDDASHDPSISLTFRNLGKTPAIVRGIHAQLLLIPRGVLPDVPPAPNASAKVTSDAVVEPEGTGGRRQWKFRKIDSKEIAALNTEATEPNHSRFFLMGYVVYDDFFGNQNTTHFCLKLRQHGFNAPRGGRRYNFTKRQAAPEPDPLAAEALDETD